MKTVGEILKKVRKEKKLTIEEIEKSLKIRKNYLLALEENDWSKLPSLPYIKGFLKNYSNFLCLKPEEMTAIFRRQFGEKERAGLLPKGLAEPLNEPVIKISPQNLITLIIISFLVIFLGYLVYQFKIYTSPPNLNVLTPKEGETITTNKIIVSGKTDSDAVLAINNQKIAIDHKGDFSTTIITNPGLNTIIIESTSKYGKKRVVNRTFQVELNQ